MVFLLFGEYEVTGENALRPRRFIDKCVREAVEPSVEEVLVGGGRIEPELFKLYQGEVHNYLCYQKNYYLPCINSHPRLKAIAEEEIRRDSEDRVKECFESLRQDSEDRGFDTDFGGLNYSIELSPGNVLIKIDKDVAISREDDSQSFKKFDAKLLSPLYDLVMIAHEIVNQESQYCNFEYNGFMLLYPEYDIRRIDYDESKIYLLTDRNSGKLFKFAIRSCAFPPGI